MAPGSPPDDPVRGLVPCFIPPRMLQSGASLLSYSLRCLGCSCPWHPVLPRTIQSVAWAVLHSAPDAPIRGVFLSYSLRCLGRSSLWHRFLPRTIQSGGLGRAPLRPGCSSPGHLLVVFPPLPRTLQPMAPGSPPYDSVRGLGRAPLRPGYSNPGRLFVVFPPLPRTLQSVAPGSPPDDPVRGLLSSAPQPHSARSCELALRAVGAARVRPGGAPLAWVWGVWGRVLSNPRPLVLSGVQPGPASLWPWVRCAGVRARLSLAPCPVPRFVVCCARFPGSRHPVAVVAWHLSLCRGCGRRRVSLASLMAPRSCAAARPVWSLSVLRSAFPSPWCLPPPRGLSPPALLAGCAGHVEAGRERGSLCLPLAPAEARALGALRVVPFRGPAMGLSLAGPSGFGLGLRALRWFGVCGPGH